MGVNFMKKIIGILLSLFLFFPLGVEASDVDYTIKNYYIDASILEDGNLEVTELIVLKGSFNGYIRDIVYQNNKLGNSGYENNRIYNASDIQMVDVSAKKENNVSFDTLYDTDFISLTKGKANNLGYLESNITSGKRYKMYFKSNNDTIAFKLKYIVKDALVLHKDVAELYWTFIGSDYEDDIKDLQIKVNLPQKDTSSHFRVWAHGEMAGEIYPYDDEYVLATVKRLEAYNPVDIRLTFSPTLLNSSLVSKKTNENALEGIIEVEQKRADEQNQKRAELKRLFYVFLGFSILHFLALIIAWIYVYIKFDKEYKSEFKNEYNRDFIDDYNVEVVDYLMNKNITPNAMSAAIMNLIYKKTIAVEEIPLEKKKKEYTFILKKEENINETEKYLVDFLFKKVGSDGKFTTKDLKNYAKGTKTCEKFSTSYMTWKNKVIKDGKAQNFFEKNAKPIIISVLFLVMSFILAILIGIFSVVLPLIFLNVFLSILFLIYTCCFFKRTKKGNEDYAKWMAFKKFLNDFGTFDTKELPEIVLWERYMVYATVFGLAEKVSKCMNVKIKELETQGIYMGGYTPTFSDWYVFHSIHNSITSSVQSNITAVTAARANSASSSGSGFGGGFSGGGGFGGGGGGGHGF